MIMMIIIQSITKVVHFWKEQTPSNFCEVAEHFCFFCEDAEQMKGKFVKLPSILVNLLSSRWDTSVLILSLISGGGLCVL